VLKIVENLWAVGAPRRTPGGGEGLLLPPENHTPVLAPVKSLGHTLVTPDINPATLDIIKLAQ